MYEKQNFTDGSVLTADHLNRMEQGIVDAHECLKTTLSNPGDLKPGLLLKVKTVGADGTVVLEGVQPSEGSALPTAATFNNLTLETAQTADGDTGVILHPEGTAEAPTLTLYGKNGDEPVQINNVAEATDDRSVPNLGQVKALLNEKDSGQNLALDTTLTQSGKAADAKAVGDALARKVAGIGIATIMAITQAKYDELVMLEQVDEATLYIIKPESEDGPDMTMIPVLRSDGVAWIDLGVAAPVGAWYEVCFRSIANMDTYDAIFGNTHTMVSSAGGGLTATWVTGYYAGSPYATFSDGTIDLSTKHTFAVTSSALILDGDTENAKAITAGTVTYKNPLYLFACNKYSVDYNRIDTVSGISAIDFFYLRIWSGENKLLHNYVPAKDGEGVACIYDTVDKAYLYNAAEAGSFEYREELEES